MSITMHYINKYGTFNFDPFVSDMTTAKIRYLNYVWHGYKAVRIVEDSWSEPDKVIWETPVKVFPKYDDPGNLPF